ncbi:MAG: hypothetical protein WD751_00755 [Anaerolineales bacterium]
MPRIQRPIPITLLAWFAMLGWDFLLHGGLLARFYVADDPVLLSPLEAFQRIPLGYASFLMLAVLLVWLMPRFELKEGRAAFGFGVKIGALLWGSFVLGLVSIVRFDILLGAGWFIGQTLGLGIGAVVVQQAAAASNLKRVTFFVVLFFIVCASITVILQSTGLAPALIIAP